MEEKINIAELLKDCPKGMELDCTMFENVILSYVKEDCKYPIGIETPDGIIALNEYGYYFNTEHAKCVIFPKGKTTWEGFVPPCQFKDGDVISDSLGTCMGELKKTRYNQRIWLNKDDSPSTGSFVAFDGDTTHYGNIARNMFVSISDCYQSARLHLAEDDTIEDFISKLKKLRNGLSDFIDHLEKNKQ